MRVTAYVLVADPNFLSESLRSYYHHVDRIVLSYDKTSVSWTGTAIPVQECLDVIETVDTNNKCVHAPGSYARLDHDPLDNDTHQRQQALDLASEGADWVLQLDTDEVMLDPEQFFRSLHRAESLGASAMDYPSRWLYAQVGPGRFLEASTRFGRPAASFPGPLAIRAGTQLVQARQAEVPLYRVDLRPWNTDPHHNHGSTVHEVISPESAVLHYSWVRDHATIRRKFGWSGHAQDYSQPVVYQRWARRQRRPRQSVLTSPLRRSEWYRLVTVPEGVGK
ncbi:hypothetical protein FEF26_08015 [Nesterenkonia salmonea]|uniref:Glycosyltransferase family 2 protein n=1 Tax=Nesterenkonia salmonea TaxID=1804987 RepID=A0A5R9BC14_9MICC|nr:hypothetical protein [Nesterenkonia salmonea]TLP97039.1 hypothetical protein FEF26_08015 [Nesterenkonia salmonea]